MGGAGSGGYKNSPGDVETHSAWDLIDPVPGTAQKLRQARCKYCRKEMAQHTSRQRAHLLGCHAYLEVMKSRGTENSITRQAADPVAFVKPRRPEHAATIAAAANGSTEKRKPTQKLTDFSMAVRIQALALAEASISYDRIREITGVEAKLLDKMRKTARQRGYDAATSMQLKDDYVADPAGNGQSRPKKPRADGAVTMLENGDGQAPADRAIPGYVRSDASSLPPGNWNLMSPDQGNSSSGPG